MKIFLGFWLLFAMTSSGGYEVTDAHARAETAKSWLEGRGGDISSVFKDEHLSLAIPGRNGHLYAVYGPLQSILMIPGTALARIITPAHVDAVAKLFFMLLVFPAMAAIGLVLLRHVLLKCGFSPAQAFVGVIVVGACTPYWHYARSGQEENIVSFAYVLYMLGFLSIGEGKKSGVWLVVAALCAAIATRWSIAFVVAILGAAALVELWRQRAYWAPRRATLLAAVFTTAAVAVALLAYNAWRFGSPFNTGYGTWFRRNGLTMFAPAATPKTMLALLASPYRGLLLFSPALVLLIFARWDIFPGTAQRLVRVGIIANLVNLVFIATLSIWHAGSAWGPRYLISASILLAPALLTAIYRTRLAIPVLAVAAAVQVMSVVLPSSTEDYVYASRGNCTPWTCQCTAACVRPLRAARAIKNTLVDAPFPALDESTKGIDSILRSSDFNTVYWWPVRAAYHTHRIRPLLALLLSGMGILVSALLLWRGWRDSSLVSPD